MSGSVFPNSLLLPPRRGAALCYYRRTCHCGTQEERSGLASLQPRVQGEHSCRGLPNKSSLQAGQGATQRTHGALRNPRPTEPGSAWNLQTLRQFLRRGTHITVISCIRRPLRTERPADLHGQQQQKHPEPLKALTTTKPLSVLSMESPDGLPGSKGSPSLLLSRPHQPARESLPSLDLTGGGDRGPLWHTVVAHGTPEETAQQSSPGTLGNPALGNPQG